MMSEDLLSGFRHFTSIQIRFKDLDALNHVNNANHITYLELARTKYLDEVIGEYDPENGIGFILARTEIDYKKPIFYQDKIEVATRTSRLGEKSLEMEYVIWDRKSEAAKALAKCVIVIFDYRNHRSVPLLSSWKERIMAFDQNLNR